MKLRDLISLCRLWTRDELIKILMVGVGGNVCCNRCNVVDKLVQLEENPGYALRSSLGRACALSSALRI